MTYYNIINKTKQDYYYNLILEKNSNMKFVYPMSENEPDINGNEIANLFQIKRNTNKK